MIKEMIKREAWVIALLTSMAYGLAVLSEFFSATLYKFPVGFIDVNIRSVSISLFICIISSVLLSGVFYAILNPLFEGALYSNYVKSISVFCILSVYLYDVIITSTSYVLSVGGLIYAIIFFFILYFAQFAIVLCEFIKQFSGNYIDVFYLRVMRNRLLASLDYSDSEERKFIFGRLSEVVKELDEKQGEDYVPRLRFNNEGERKKSVKIKSATFFILIVGVCWGALLTTIKYQSDFYVFTLKSDNSTYAIIKTYGDKVIASKTNGDSLTSEIFYFKQDDLSGHLLRLKEMNNVFVKKIPSTP